MTWLTTYPNTFVGLETHDSFVNPFYQHNNSDKIDADEWKISRSQQPVRPRRLEAGGVTANGSGREGVEVDGKRPQMDDPCRWGAGVFKGARFSQLIHLYRAVTLFGAGPNTSLS